jgi:hypothetical protein
VYKDWDDFLNNNQLPKCTYCYPRRGVYDGDDNDKVYLEFGETPASKPGSILLSALDTASTAVMVSSAVLCSYFVYLSLLSICVSDKLTELEETYK